ncbi:hypothetical protein PHLCEN_2v378 [Hermanssonia centrifuga]|uniref:Uncharacterized protein n=1 Tax=Hermanssonia centrifuga TaxID=98765 RepID=A0A2R6S660_9APHY|nr:hypothetical protein PHLCEN_2v378 [Hermanssonia centrifuga]
MSNPAYKPDEDAATIFQEDTWLQGALVMCIAYGSVATLAIQCFFMLVRGLTRAKFKRDFPLVLFVMIMFTLSTIFIGTAMQFTQQAYVDQLLGTLFLKQIMSVSPWGAVNFTLGFWCFSLALNVLATFLIVSRLLLYRFRLARVLGSGHGAQYTSVVAMVVESELLYTAFLILFIVPFVLNHPLENVFIQCIALIQAISALMIVYRVAAGHGWTKDTYAQVSTRMHSTIQLSNLSTLRAAPSASHVTQESKISSSGITVSQDVYMTKEYSSVEAV